MISNPATVADENGAASGRVTLARQGEEPGPFHPKGPAGQPNKRSRGVCSMTETERKVLAWINQVAVERGGNPVDSFDFEADVIGAALIRAIEQHEAFKQEVSDVCSDVRLNDGLHKLDRFILPETTRANHIAGAVDFANRNDWTVKTNALTAKRLEEVLARHGLKIVEDKP